MSVLIEDNDLPITVAQKIITGTKPNNPTPTMKMIGKMLTGDETACDTVDMFSLEEIEEIMMYLATYISAHEEGD